MTNTRTLEPRAYYVGALNAFTTSKDEAEKMGKQFPVEALYPAAAYETLENERDELKQNLEDLQERFNGIKFIESELRKELTALESERNRRDEMRKALEAQMGISKKWQP